MSIEIIFCLILLSFTISTLLPSSLSKIINGATSLFVSAMLLSLLYFLLLVVGANYGIQLFAYFSFVVLLFILSASNRNITIDQVKRLIPWKHSNYHPNTSDIAFLVLSLMSLGGYYYYAQLWGGWDGWAIWNMHAKQLLSADLAFIQNPALDWSHTDYPLGIPGLIALLHKSAFLSAEIALHTHALTWITFQFTMYGILKSLKTPKFVLWVILIPILLNPHILVKAGSQMADVAIALAILLSWSFHLQTRKSTSGKIEYPSFLWLGLIVSFAIWIKNEGVVFFLFFSLIMLNHTRFNLKKILFYFLGASPTLLVWAYFKLFLAPKNPLFNTNRFTQFLNNIANWERWEYIISSVASSYIDFYIPFLLVIGYLVLLIFRGHLLPLKSGLIVLAMCFTAYILAYFITPYDYKWHIDHSIDRLIFQLLPALLVILVSKNPKTQISSDLTKTIS